MVVALTRRIDRLLIDQHGIDDAAHLDELLPVTAVAGETRDFPRRDRTDLPRQTSATIRSKPARATPPAAERPRSSSTVSMRDQPSAETSWRTAASISAEMLLRCPRNTVRTHRSLNKDAPVSRTVQQTGVITSRAIMGGLHRHYGRI
jgi:hypothetical protein